MALRLLAESCELSSITPDKILRDCLAFGIREDKVRERLLRETQLTLAKTDEICRAVESMMAQMKVVGDTPDAVVHAIQPQCRPGSTYKSTQKRADMNKPHRKLWADP